MNIKKCKFIMLVLLVIVFAASLYVGVKSRNVNAEGPLTVLSPNGGEMWAKGAAQTILWQDNSPSPELNSYNISLAVYYPPCYERFCTSYPSHLPYSIASGVQGSSYKWSVGKLSDPDIHTAPDGMYVIQVCLVDGSVCDLSDNYFEIVSGSANAPIHANGRLPI
jgi:hypothetical protein